MCLPCPWEGVDCTVQTEVKLLDGWYRDTGEAIIAESAANPAIFNISVSLAMAQCTIV